MSHVRRPRHHRASTRRLAGARPDGVHRGWIHPLHDRAVDVFRPLLTPCSLGRFRHCRHPMEMRPYPAVPARSVHTPQALVILAVFWPYTPLHPLKKPGLNGHFSLFAIWPAISSRSSLISVAVLAPVCANAQTLEDTLFSHFSMSAYCVASEIPHWSRFVHLHKP